MHDDLGMEEIGILPGLDGYFYGPHAEILGYFQAKLTALGRLDPLPFQPPELDDLFSR